MISHIFKRSIHGWKYNKNDFLKELYTISPIFSTLNNPLQQKHYPKSRNLGFLQKVHVKTSLFDFLTPSQQNVIIWLKTIMEEKTKDKKLGFI